MSGSNLLALRRYNAIRHDPVSETLGRWKRFGINDFKTTTREYNIRYVGIVSITNVHNIYNNQLSKTYYIYIYTYIGRYRGGCSFPVRLSLTTSGFQSIFVFLHGNYLLTRNTCDSRIEFVVFSQNREDPQSACRFPTTRSSAQVLLF